MNAFETEIDELMRGIREEVRQKRERAVGQNVVAPSVEDKSPLDNSVIDQALIRADKVHAVGENLPPMTRHSGFRRILATSVARSFLRLAQIITRDQRQFNYSVLVVLRAMHDRIFSLHNGLAAIEKQRATRVEALEQRLVELQESAASRAEVLEHRVKALEQRLVEVQESAVSRGGEA